MDDIDVLEDLLIIKAISEIKDCKLPPLKKVKKKRKSSNYTGGEDIVIEKDPTLFEEYTRINTSQFKTLVNLLKPALRRVSHRRAITPEARLYITLCFLGHGCTLSELSAQFGIGMETARSVILDTCDALWNILSKLYVCPPTEAEWQEISRNFYESHQVPHCIGALDGVHFKLGFPPQTHKLVYKKKFNSIMLLASCDCNYCFTLVDFCDSEPEAEKGPFYSSQFGQEELTATLDIPKPDILPNSDNIFPYFFVAGNAFPLKENIMKTYGKVVDMEHEYFNEMLSSIKQRIDTAFTQLTAQWQILKNHLSFSAKNAKRIVLAAVALHNFVRFFRTDTNVAKAFSYLTPVDVHDLRTLNIAPQNILAWRNTLLRYLYSCQTQPVFLEF